MYSCRQLGAAGRPVGRWAVGATRDQLTKSLDAAHITCHLKNTMFPVVLIIFQVYALDGTTVSHISMFPLECTQQLNYRSMGLVIVVLSVSKERKGKKRIKVKLGVVAEPPIYTAMLPTYSGAI